VSDEWFWRGRVSAESLAPLSFDRPEATSGHHERRGHPVEGPGRAAANHERRAV